MSVMNVERSAETDGIEFAWASQPGASDRYQYYGAGGVSLPREHESSIT
jgi:hypothetical protein